MIEETKVEAQFLKEIANHEMTILKNDGIYRHLRFKNKDSSFYWFEIITWPNALCINGDCGSYVFTRNQDMFNFFRIERSGLIDTDKTLDINPDYWAEKCIAKDRSDGIDMYSVEKLNEIVKDHFDDYFHDFNPEGDADKEAIMMDCWRELRYSVLNREFEIDAKEDLADFDYIDKKHNVSFGFGDSWEYNLRTWTHRYLWNLYAIVWGIKQFDEYTKQNSDEKFRIKKCP